MDLIPVLNNWQEIVAVSGGYVYASIDISRRLSWKWSQTNEFLDNVGRLGAWAVSFFVMPLALIMVRTGGSENWDKPPRSVRKLEKRKEQVKEFERLQKENERLEELLGIGGVR